jgi:hypothetical protein
LVDLLLEQAANFSPHNSDVREGTENAVDDADGPVYWAITEAVKDAVRAVKELRK